MPVPGGPMRTMPMGAAEVWPFFMMEATSCSSRTACSRPPTAERS